jgi:hypothetical protein
MTKLHPIFETILADLGMPQSHCERCEAFGEVHDQNCSLHEDYDPTPYCGACGARRAKDCHCGPLAEND